MKIRKAACYNRNGNSMGSLETSKDDVMNDWLINKATDSNAYVIVLGAKSCLLVTGYARLIVHDPKFEKI